MKTKLCLFAMLALMTAARGATNDLSAQLQKGLFEEEANRDLTAAIANYQSLANDFDKDRQIAATAVFRLGECYRKLGKTNEAVVQYQRILKEFSDQQTLVMLSRQNLTGLNVASMAPGTGANEASLVEAEGNVALLQAQIQEIEKMPREKARIYVQQNFPNPVLTTLVQQLDAAEQNLTSLKIDYTEDHPKYKSAQEVVSDLTKKVDAQVDGVLDGLRTKLAVAQQSQVALQRRLSSNPITSEQMRQLEWVKKLQTMPLNEVRQIAPTVLTDATLINLIYQYNQADLDLVRLRADHAEEHPEVQKEKAIESALQDKIKERLQGMEKALSMETGNSVASSRGGGESAEPITDEEQQQIRRIQLMIQNSPDLINAVGPDGITPLQDAAMKGQLSVAKYLLDHGADVNRTGSSGPARETALFKAANNGHKAMVELLISRGADINSFNPLERVVSKNYASVAEVLLEHNAEVNYHGSESRVPLHDAAANGATNLIRLLIEHGADLSARDYLGATPLHLAAAAGQIDAAKMLVAAKAPIEATNNDAATPLHAAAQMGRADMISLLLDSGARVDATNDHNVTPLLLAVNSGAPQAVGVLLAHKADPNHAGSIKYSPGNFGYPTRPIYFAIRQPKILEMLLKAGADSEGQPDLQNTPLGSALGAPNIESARLLLEHGANPNHNSGDSPLGIALGKPEDKPVIPLLLEKGADSNGKNKDGLAPLFLTSDPEIGRWLIDHKADVNARFTEAQGSRNRPPGGASPPGMSVGFDGFLFGHTPLMRAAVRATEFAKFLLDNGAKADLQDTNGNTALHYAAFYARPEGVTVLLEHKANPNIQNDAGYTPLDIAKSGTGGNMEYGMLGGINYHVGTGTSAENEKQIAELLTQAGGLANLPKRNRIEVRRASNSGVAFTKGSHDWNQYSLLEMIAGEYRLLSQSTAGEWRKSSGVRANLWNDCLRFPDFKNVTIYRRSDGSAKQKAINVDVEEILHSGDCSRDMRLDWGDVIEIPESDHPVDVAWTGLSAQTVTALTNCLARQVTVTVKGVSTSLKLMPEIKVQYFTQGMESRDGLELTSVSFMLRSVLDNSKLVRVSSDLSRVKVTRTDPDTKKKQEWVIDCTDANVNQADLWLRDGDVVDVPEK